jgi:hypothetical protein
MTLGGAGVSASLRTAPSDAVTSAISALWHLLAVA